MVRLVPLSPLHIRMTYPRRLRGVIAPPDPARPNSGGLPARTALRELNLHPVSLRGTSHRGIAGRVPRGFDAACESAREARRVLHGDGEVVPVAAARQGPALHVFPLRRDRHAPRTVREVGVGANDKRARKAAIVLELGRYAAADRIEPDDDFRKQAGNRAVTGEVTVKAVRTEHPQVVAAGGMLQVPCVRDAFALFDRVAARQVAQSTAIIDMEDCGASAR